MTYEERAEWLKQNTHLTTIQASEILHVSDQALRKQCKRYGIKMTPGYPQGVWHKCKSVEERKGLINNFFGKKTCVNMARVMGCTEETIRQFCNEHKLETEIKFARPRKDKTTGTANEMMAKALSSPRLGL